MDKRFPKMQELLENVISKIQSLQIQSSAGNIAALYETIANIQVVYNTLDIIRNEQMKNVEEEKEEDDREADPQ